MKTCYLKDKSAPRKIVQNKRILEQKLKVKISIKGKKLDFTGNEVDEFVSDRVFDAIDFGFSVNDALLLCEEDMLFEKMHIRDFTRRKNLEEVRGRIVGTKGKTIRTLANLSGCLIQLRGNELGIIGPSEDIDEAMQALENLIRGSKQTNVYSFLEKQNQNKKKLPDDLGLKETIIES